MTSNTHAEIEIHGGDYEHTCDIAGEFAGGIRLKYAAKRVQEIFVPMLKERRFEVCEFSLANYIILRAGGEHWLTAVPVFPFRAFRHSLAITRRDSAFTGLAQLAGKRIGVEDYSMTAAVWFRGLIEDEYGVDHRAITWVTPRTQRFPFPRGAPVDVTDANLEDLLCTGAIDAMLGFATRDSRLPPPQRKLRPLLDDSRAVERAYYEKTSIYPINHCVVIRNDVLTKYPAITQAVHSAYALAKENAYRRRLGATLAPWGKEHWTDTFELFGGDPLPYGLTDINRRVVATLAGYLQRQGFIDKVPDLDELFAPA
jgi:4,5-dihydroxyphthalate decarboxylase